MRDLDRYVYLCCYPEEFLFCGHGVGHESGTLVYDRRRDIVFSWNGDVFNGISGSRLDVIDTVKGMRL